ncbi:MAG: hypothetical protein R2810_03530 [Flavobacteriales bacterium]
MQNDGAGNFTNVTTSSGVDLHTGQSIEWTTHDFATTTATWTSWGWQGVGPWRHDLHDISTNNNSSPVGDLNNDG